MKHLFYHTLLLACILIAIPASAQEKKISIDIAVIRQTFHQVNGLNLSTFYHFNERLAAGVEMNRFFPVLHKDQQLSAWDFDFNGHYLFDLHHHLFFYPIAGFSHTFSQEQAVADPEEISRDRFWSVNAGSGLMWMKGKWGMHAEFLYTWGQFNQEFVLAGLNYEIELGRKHKHEAHQ